MDNIRLFLWAGLGVLLWLSFQAWQQDNAPPPSAIASGDPSITQSASDPSGTLPAVDDLPSLPEVSAPGTDDRKVSAPDDDESSAQIGATKMVRVLTDVLDLEINLIGGDLQSAGFSVYPVT